MGATYTRQSSYSDGDTITAAHTNDEFNQLLAAFAASTGHTHDGTAAEGGPITKLLGTSITIGDATSGTDITVTFDGESNDGVLKWMEDEDYFEFSDDILVASTEKIQFRDTAIYINSSTDGQLDLVADTEIQLAATTVDLNGNLDVSGSITLGGTAITSTAAELNILDGVTSTTAELNILDGATATATELNVMDGDTSATSTTLADADRVVVNDAGTMKQVALTDFETYFESALDTLSNVTTIGTLDSGAISSGFGNIDIGSSNLTATGTISLGATSFNDNNITNVGSIQLDSIAGDADTNTSIPFSGSDVITIATGGTTALTIDASQNVTVAGDLTVTGDDITMGTNTAGNLLIADGTNFNSVAVGSLSEISTVANDDVFLAVDTSGGGLKKITRSAIVSGLATSSAISNVSEDSTPQLGGDLDVNGQDIVSVSNGNITITPNGSGVVRLDGNVDIQSGLIDLKNSGSRSQIKFYCESGNAHAQTLQAAPHSESASNTLTLPSTGGYVKLVSTASTATLTNKTFGDNVSFGDNNITNVGDIALDSISADGTDINVAVSDNSATAFTIKQGSDNYLVIDTANSSESVAIGTGISGTAISIGHSTSETTINDNLTVTGDLTVNGSTTTVDTTNLAVKDTLLGLNQGAGSNSNDVGIIIERGSTGNDALFMWDESEEKVALGTTTSNASSTGNLNMTTGTLVANIEGNVTGNVTGNVSGTAATVTTAAQSNITSLGTLTTLTVDNVIINGTTIGHTDDTDLITLADGIATVAGEISVTTLDIGGTNVTSTAAELNILDGVTSTATELNVMDGDTSATSTTLADADRLVTNDAGTMKQVALTDVKTYLTSAGFTTDDPTALAIALG